MPPKPKKACHCSDDALAGQPVARFYAHVCAPLGNNDLLIDCGYPDSLHNFLMKLIIIAAAFINAAVADPDLDATLPKSTIIIEATEDACYRFDVYVATTRQQQIRGLMDVRHLPEFTGMLFIYGMPEMRSATMTLARV